MQVLSLNAQGFQVLVPVNMVAQILGKSPLESADGSARDALPFFCGKLPWREFKVPLFDISALHVSGNASSDYERMVVLWPLASAGRRGFMALTSLGPPRVIDIDDKSLSESAPEFDYMAGSVKLADGLGIIPDLQKLSNQYFPAAA